MATLFTPEELLDFTKALVERAPATPAIADGSKYQQVWSITTAGGPAGILLNADTEQGPVKLYPNPVVALQLILHIFQTHRDVGWWDDKMNLIPKPD